MAGMIETCANISVLLLHSQRCIWTREFSMGADAQFSRDVKA